MRIVVANEAVDGAGGVETYLNAIVPALRARGHRVAILYHHGTRARTRTSPDLFVDIQEHGFDGAFAALRDWRADVCFSHNMAPLEVERRALTEWPVVKMMHGYFGTCVSGLKSHGFPSLRPCDRVFGPACLAMYGPRRCGPLSPMRMLSGYQWASGQHSLLPRYAGVVVASSHMAREYSRHGVRRERLNILPLFSDLGGDAAEPSGDAVLFAGRMTKLKGGDVLIAAMAAVNRRVGRSVPLIMAGAGPQLDEWRAAAGTLGVDAEFPGWVEGSARVAIFRRTAVLAVPSVWPEPFGLVGVEAGAFRIPAVAFDVGGIREWLRQDVNGRLVRVSDGVAGLAREIAALLLDPARRRRLGECARDTSQALSLDQHVHGLEQVLQQALSTRS